MEIKKCSRCQELKDIELFYKCSATKDNHSSMCKDCARIAKAEWRKKHLKRSREINRQNYYNHKEAWKKRTRKYQLKNKKNWSVYIIKDKCEICGYNEYDILEYHHVNPKEKKVNITEFTQSRKCTEESEKLFLDEIKKCIVVCPNCHREIHYKWRNLCQKSPCS